MPPIPGSPPPPNEAGDGQTRIVAPPPPVRGLPARVGEYRVLKLLGEGGMGLVALAEDETLKRKVAVKLVRRELVGNDMFVSRFLREARLSASLNHPNIVTTHGAGTHDGLPYLVLEFVEGRTLRELLRTPPPIPLRRVLEIHAQCCEGLAAAAARGIVHRDIKPANIMVRDDGLVKVMDFGLSKSIDGESMSITNTVLGTPEYMSPEQGAGTDVDFRTDVYALGITLFQCATGYLPFTASSVAEMVVKHTSHPLPHDERLAEVCGGRLFDLVQRMTAKAREDRPSNYQQVRAELLAIRDELESRATPAPPRQDKQPTVTLPVARMQSPAQGVLPPLPASAHATPPPTASKAPLFAGVALVAVLTGVIGFLLADRGGSKSAPAIGAPMTPRPSPTVAAAAPTPPEPAGPDTIDLRSGNARATLSDVLDAAATLGANVVIEKGVDPSSKEAVYSLNRRRAEDLMRVAALAAGWRIESRDSVNYLIVSPTPAHLLVRDSRADGAGSFPRVSVDTRAGVTLREACETLRRDAGIDYLIIGPELAKARVARFAMTGQPLDQVMSVMGKDLPPHEWTLTRSTLVVVLRPATK